MLADDWVWPFRPELVDWKQCAVILPEKDAGEKAIAYLDSISEEERCRMRQACRMERSELADGKRACH